MGRKREGNEVEGGVPVDLVKQHSNCDFLHSAQRAVNVAESEQRWDRAPRAFDGVLVSDKDLARDNTFLLTLSKGCFSERRWARLRWAQFSLTNQV
ncbi:hypothetical protein FGB62_333g00 [Gracilaria domingensis]|nr:hypothetical protein FGB62_333g00 [Gracilaria domingensis]